MKSLNRKIKLWYTNLNDNSMEKVLRSGLLAYIFCTYRMPLMDEINY